MAKVEVLHYTDKELAAIEVLKAHRGVKMSAKELGIPTAILTSLSKKANDEKLQPQIRESAEKLVKRIMSKTGFVSIWQLSKDAKKKLDINQIALLRIFFQKLIELIKNCKSYQDYVLKSVRQPPLLNIPQ